MPKFQMAALAAALLAFTASAQAQTQSKYERLTEALWSQVNENYYDPYFRDADWAGLHVRYTERAHTVTTDAQFLALANDMLAQIPSSHLYISAPSEARPTGIAVSFEDMNGAPIAREVEPLSDAYAQGVRVGDRLISDRAVLRGDLGTPATFTVQHCDGRRATLTAQRQRAFWPPEHPGLRWRSITPRPGVTIGYIRADRFDDGAAELADAAMAELGDTQALIIDVRANSGGNTSALRLASYFGRGAEPGVVLMSRPYLLALGHAVTPADVAAAPRVNGAYTDAAVFGAVSAHNGGAAFWTDDVPHKYTRPVFILIGEDTGSAAEGFAWYMRTHTQARMIGRTTSGELLSAEGFDLGDGWRVTIPVHGLWGSDGTDYGDRAVTPHETIAWTRADVCAGRDPDLAAALREATAP